MTQPSSIPSTIASRYRVIRELGRGGMGAVYLVEHAHTADHLALKLLHGHAGAKPDVVARFKREARAPAQIRSENVVKVTDADVAEELGGAPFLVMELLNGSDLEKMVEERGPLPPSDVVNWLSQVARALDKAHAIGIVHRDLKPENLFLHEREDGTTILKILDFGIAKAVGSEAGGSTAEGGGLTKSGAIFGTPLYMSPEQAHGRHEIVGPPTDQWAIGLIAYRLLTGQVYWQANTFAELVLQIVSEPMPPPSSRIPALGAGFDAWFARSCERDPGRRWRTVGDQVTALTEALGLAPAVAASAPLAAPAPLVAPPPIAPTIVEPVPDGPTLESPGIGTTGSPLSRTTPQAEGPRKGSLAAAIAIGAVFVVGATVTLGAIAVRSLTSPEPSVEAVEESASAAAAAAPPSSEALPEATDTLHSASAAPGASTAPTAKVAPPKPALAKPATTSSTKPTTGKAAAPAPAPSPAPAPKPFKPAAPTKSKPYSPEAP